MVSSLIFCASQKLKMCRYTEPDVDSDKLETFNYENSALFLISCFQYILVAGVFSVGPPYRKPLYSNRTSGLMELYTC
jgi:magnesium-transporting ATPase (P-type)